MNPLSSPPVKVYADPAWNERVREAAPALYRALRRLVRERCCERVLHGSTPCPPGGRPCRICQGKAALALVGPGGAP